jgi:predicted CopG family antitoxin
MIKFFRKIRQKLITESKFSKYLIYAIGEIVLVVIGILIALQINNSNEIRKSRNKEVSYLINIKDDLNTNSEKISSLIERRNKRTEVAHKLIGHIEGEPVLDWHEFNLEIIKIYTWERFYQHNYTFEELISSGNLSFIRNDSIKTLLFDLESTYKQLKAEEDHWRFDAEELVFKPSYEDLDMQLILRDYRGEKNLLKSEVFKEFFEDRKVKNGYVMATVEFGIMNSHLKKMNQIIEQLLGLIDKEITKG